MLKPDDFHAPKKSGLSGTHLYHDNHCNQCHCEEKHIYQEALRKEPNLELDFASAISFCPFLSRISFSIFILGPQNLSVSLGALNNFGVKFKNLY